MAEYKFRLSAGSALRSPEGYTSTMYVLDIGGVESSGSYRDGILTVTDGQWRPRLEAAIKDYGTSALPKLRAHCAEEAKRREEMRQKHPDLRLGAPDQFRGVQVMVTVPKGYRKPPGYNAWEADMKARDGFLVADPEPAKAPEPVPA